MNPFLKALNVSLGEQIHIAAWPVYPGKETLKYPDPATNVADPASDLVTPAYAIETGTWTLAPFQRLSVEGLKKNTPEGVEPETDPSTYNGHARIYKPDGSLVAKPDKDFDGLMVVDVRISLRPTLTFANFFLDRPEREPLDQGSG
jgi:cyanide hydratase